MRITGGKARGIPLKAPAGDKVRPAMDAMREAVFSHLGPLIEGSQVLDLFAGTGAYGLEALSRGAAKVQFIEKDRKALAAIKHNITSLEKSLGGPARAICQQADVFAWLLRPQETYDIIIADPPYAILEDKARALVEQCAKLLKPDTESRLILECPGSFEMVGTLPVRLVKRLGKGKQQPSLCVYAWGGDC